MSSPSSRSPESVASRAVESVALRVAATQPAAHRLYRALSFTEWGREPAALLVDGEYIDEDYLTLVL